MALLNGSETEVGIELVAAIVERDLAKIEAVLKSSTSDSGCLAVEALDKLTKQGRHVDEEFYKACISKYPHLEMDHDAVSTGKPMLSQWRSFFATLIGELKSQEEIRQALSVLSLLFQHGWRAHIEDLNTNALMLGPFLHVRETLQFIVDNEVLNKEIGAPVYWVAHALRKEGALEMRVAHALVAKGYWSNEVLEHREDEMGILPLAQSGLIKCAMMMLGHGVEPRPFKSQTFIAAAWGVAGAMVNFFLMENQKREGAERVDLEKMLESLGKAKVDVNGKAEDVLWALADRARHSVGDQTPLMRKQEAQTVKALRALLKVGVVPKDDGKLMGEAVSRLERVQWDEAFFDGVVGAGALNEKTAGSAMAGPARWSIKGVKKAQVVERSKVWFDKIAAMGFDPKDLPSKCEGRAHPVAHAVEHGSYEFAGHAIDKGVSPCWECSVTGDGLFHKLAGKKSAAPMALRARLLKDERMKAWVGKANGKGETPLMAACKALDKEMVAEWLAAGAELNARDAKGKTALMHAGLKHGEKADKAMSPIVQMLLEAGADASIGSAKGVSVGMAMAAGAPIEAIRTLSKARPEEFDAKDPNGAKALAAVSKRGSKTLSAVEQVLLGAHPDKSEGEAMGPTKRKRL